MPCQLGLILTVNKKSLWASTKHQCLNELCEPDPFLILDFVFKKKIDRVPPSHVIWCPLERGPSDLQTKSFKAKVLKM